jgi:hypothetical protein
MKCPNDSATLVMSERSGVEIDYCPECRGVWLDRGELDKIIDRAETEIQGRSGSGSAPAAPNLPPVAPPFPDQRYTTPAYGDRDRGYNDGYRRTDGYRPRKKENWLSELFD